MATCSGLNVTVVLSWHRWVGHGTMVLLTLHGFGFYGIWLYTAEYTRGLVWDRTGERSPCEGSLQGSAACPHQPVAPVLHCQHCTERCKQCAWQPALHQVCWSEPCSP